MGRDMKKLRKLNNELDKKISSENQPVFTDMSPEEAAARTQMPLDKVREMI